jgi:hypothetical protein
LTAFGREAAQIMVIGQDETARAAAQMRKAAAPQSPVLFNRPSVGDVL